MKIYRLSAGEFRSWRDRDARLELLKRIHALHGTSQVRSPGGQILGTARGITDRVPIERARIRRAHHAVAPGECICREWQKPPGKEDEHHPICALREAWEAQQAHSPDAPRERVIVTAAGDVRTASAATDAERDAIEQADMQPPPTEPSGSNALPATEQEEVSEATSELAAPAAADTSAERAKPASSKPCSAPAPGPENCFCKDWAGAVEGKHHPICEFRERWEREHGIAAPLLIDLETGQVVREATASEAEASKTREAQDGVGSFELSDGRLYYVRQP